MLFRPRASRHLIRSIVAMGLGILALLAIDLLFLLDDSQIKANLHRGLTYMFAPGSRFRIGDARFRLLPGRLEVEDVEVRGPEGVLCFRIRKASLLLSYSPPGLREVECIDAQLYLERRKGDETFNIGRLIEGLEIPEEVTLRTASFQDVSVYLRDEELFPPGVIHGIEDVGATISGLEGGDFRFAGSGRTSLSKKPLEMDGRFNVDRAFLDGSLALEDLRLTDRLGNRIPSEAQEVWQLLQPSGTTDVRGTLRLEAGRLAQEWTAELKGMKGRVEPFPYPLENVTGRVVVRPDLCRLENLRTRDPDRPDLGAQCNGTIDLSDESLPLNLEIDAWNVPFDETFILSLPEETIDVVSGFDPSGLLSGRVEIWGFIDAPPPMGVRIEGRLSDGSTRPDVCPLPVRDLSGRFMFESGLHTLLRVDRLSGRAAGGRVTASGTVGRDGERVNLRVVGTGIDTESEELRDALRDGESEDLPRPEFVSQFAGPVDLALGFRKGPEQEELSVSGLLMPKATRFQPPEFPYPFHLEGDVAFSGESNRLRLDVGLQPGSLQVVGTDVPTPEELDEPFDLFLEAREIVLGQELWRSATEGTLLPAEDRERLRALKKALQPIGALSGSLHLYREEKDAPLRLEGDARLSNLFVHPDASPVPVEDGHLDVTLHPERATLELTGRVAGGTLTGNGTFDWSGADPTLTLTCHVEDARLDPISKTSRPGFDILKELRPAGLANLDLKLERKGSGETDVDLLITLKGATFYPEFLPFPFADTRGEVEVRNDRIYFRNVRTRVGSGQVFLRGETREPAKGESPDFLLRLEGREIPIDNRFEEALPSGFGSFFAEMNPTGMFDFDASLYYDSVQQEVYYLGTVTFSELAAELGIRFDKVRGSIDVRGHTVDRTEPIAWGQLRLDRAEWKGHPITDIRGLFTVRNGRFDLPDLTAHVYDGFLTGEYYAFFEEPKSYFGDFILKRARFGPFAARLLQREDDAGGVMEGRVLFEGIPGQRTAGLGSLRVFRARLADLPGFFNLLKPLAGRIPAGDVYFKDIYSNFRLDGETIEFEDLKVFGNALSLVLDRTTTNRARMSGDVDLKMVAASGTLPYNPSNPILEPLIGILKKALVGRVRIQGNLFETLQWEYTPPGKGLLDDILDVIGG